ncbi:MAG: hypothetical protein MK088_05275 [Alteromonas sp.]|nr:hypothetical protein [Alteromonas sp.]
MSIEFTLKNITFQCRRAATLLDVKLSSAKLFVARAVYQCHNYQDLVEKIERRKLKRSVFPYSQITPHSDLRELKHLDDNLPELSKRVLAHLREPVSHFQSLHLIWNLFGVQGRPAARSVDGNIEFDSWYIINYSNQCSDSVLMFECCINNLPYQIYLTKIVNAHAFQNYSKLDIELLSEQVFSEVSPPPVLWMPLALWKAKLDQMLNDLRVRKPIDMITFFELINTASDEQKHHERLLRDVFTSLELMNLGTQFEPFQRQSEQFQVVGFPVKHGKVEGKIESLPTIELEQKHISNNKCLIVVSGQPLTLDLLPITDDSYITNEDFEYTEAYSSAVLSFANSDTKLSITIGQDEYLAFVRNATKAEINRYIDSCVTLNTDYS